MGPVGLHHTQAGTRGPRRTNGLSQRGRTSPGRAGGTLAQAEASVTLLKSVTSIKGAW